MFIASRLWTASCLCFLPKPCFHPAHLSICGCEGAWGRAVVPELLPQCGSLSQLGRPRFLCGWSAWHPQADDSGWRRLAPSFARGRQWLLRTLLPPAGGGGHFSDKGLIPRRGPPGSGCSAAGSQSQALGRARGTTSWPGLSPGASVEAYCGPGVPAASPTCRSSANPRPEGGTGKAGLGSLSSDWASLLKVGDL